MMYKLIRRSQAQKYKLPFGAVSFLKGTVNEDSPKLMNVLEDPSEISYDSSWAINPSYNKDKELSKLLRDYMTMFFCKIHNSLSFHRWISTGSVKFRTDEYVKWLGGQELLPEFKVPSINNEIGRMFYNPDTKNLPSEPLAVAERMNSEWDNRIIFTPKKGDHIGVTAA